MSSLDDLLARLTGRRPQVLGTAPAELDGCFSWDALRAVLHGGRLVASHLTLVKAGQTLAPERYTRGQGAGAAVEPEVVEQTLAAGAVLLLRKAHLVDRRLWTAVRQVQALVQNVVNANVYAGGPGSAGFGLHVDHHDVVVVQMAGRKHWQVFEPTFADPIALPDHSRGEPRQLAWEGSLEAGQALVLPRGFWHQARGDDAGDTLHVSFGIEPCTGLHLLGWLRERLLEAPAFRAEVPRFAPAEARQRYAASLVQELASRLDADLIGAYLEHRGQRVRRESDELGARLWGEEGGD